jgi:hypothetical protein
MNSEGTVSTSELSTSAILEWLKLWDYKIWHRGNLQQHQPTKFHAKSANLFKSYWGGGCSHTDAGGYNPAIMLNESRLKRKGRRSGKLRQNNLQVHYLLN